jgi:hypothetical protein
MDKQQAIDELKVQQKHKDPERAHENADEIICKFLKSLGYDDVVAEWDKVAKWYA